jgi:hypothetical protein
MSCGASINVDRFCSSHIFADRRFLWLPTFITRQTFDFSLWKPISLGSKTNLQHFMCLRHCDVWSGTCLWFCNQKIESLVIMVLKFFCDYSLFTIFEFHAKKRPTGSLSLCNNNVLTMNRKMAISFPPMMLSQHCRHINLPTRRTRMKFLFQQPRDFFLLDQAAFPNVRFPLQCHFALIILDRDSFWHKKEFNNRF